MPPAGGGAVGWLGAPGVVPIDMSMGIFMPDISMAGTGAYAGQSIRPTDSPGPNSGMKPIGTSARNNSPGISKSAQLRASLRLSLRDRLLPDEGLRG